MSKVVSIQILTDATAAEDASDKQHPWGPNMTFQASGATTAATGAAAVKVEGSDVEAPDDNDWVELGEISLTLGTTKTTGGVSVDANWRWVRLRVSSISGTGASVDGFMGGRIGRQ